MSEELKKALELIKNECSKYARCCDGCYMYSEEFGECRIVDEDPCDWEIEETK
jgi:hypothetical protein